MKLIRTGLLCLSILATSASFAQQAPPQQTPPQQTPPPAQEPQEPAPQSTQRLPPAPPKIIDVRMPGESGWFLGITGWLPVGNTYVNKGKEVTFNASSYLQLPGTPKIEPGGELGVAVGQHNSLRFSYMFAKAAGNVTAPNDLVIFSQTFSKGDAMSTSYKMSNYKISYEYLTWPYPVGNRKFRLKTLWQMQYVTFKSAYDVPIKSATPDSAGNFTDYSAHGSKSFFSPTFGLGIHEYVSRNFRIEANASGFAWPHSFNIWDADVSLAYRFGKLELRGGARGFHFRTSAKSDYYHYGTLAGAIVGLRWYSN